MTTGGAPTGYTKPLPRVVPAIDRPHWDALKKHELRMQKCSECGHIWFPPAFGCPNCLSTKYEWVQLSGKGKIWTYNVFHQLYFKSFAPEIPYNVIQVQLDEGPLMMSNIVGCKNEDIKCDMRVEIVYEDVTPDWTLPKFKPAT